MPGHRLPIWGGMRSRPTSDGSPRLFRVLDDTVEALCRLFKATPANAPVLQAFFSGRTPGTAYVDAPGGPTACVVAVNFRFVFFGGAPSPDFCDAAIRRLRRDHPLQVVWPAHARVSRHVVRPDRIVSRVEFREREDPLGARLRECRAGAAGLEPRRMTAVLLDRCDWAGEMERAVGSRSEFLAHGLGYCLVDGDEIVAEAYGMIWGLDRVEIATITHPACRGRGYAPAVCAHLIEACESMGLSTYWGCDADNAASRRVAARLGFCHPRKYRILDYDRFPVQPAG